MVVTRDAADFEEWVSPHVHAMGLLATRLVGWSNRDDVVQEALTRAWRKMAQFDPGRGTPRSWLLAIVADRARRARRRQPRMLGVDVAPVAAPDGSVIDLERAIASLPPRMRLAVSCVYFVDLTIAETASVMGVSQGTVKSTLFDARTRLRMSLEDRSA